MKALLFAGVWVVVAFGVFFFAFRPKGGRTGESKPTGLRGNLPGGARGLLAAAVLAAVVVTPILVTASASDRVPSGAGTYTIESSEHLREGRTIFRETCASCHTLSASNARGVYGPNLDQRGLQVGDREAAALRVETAIKLGPGNMPGNLLAGEQAKRVSEYVAEVAGK
ncbi:MAG: cytochrome c [Solirubrobacterales bacterium]